MLQNRSTQDDPNSFVVGEERIRKHDGREKGRHGCDVRISAFLWPLHFPRVESRPVAFSDTFVFEHQQKRSSQELVDKNGLVISSS